MESSDVCYCSGSAIDPDVIICISCKKPFHRTCLKSGPPSVLAGDVYFKFVCSNCSETQVETIERMKLQWIIVILLAVYNLQLQGSGKCGFFRWREDICRFIDKNWNAFFGYDRKKAATWHHTIAGVLSANCNKYFISGAEQLGEKGWWALKNPALPTVEELENIQAANKANRKGRLPLVLDPMSIVEGTRQRNKNILDAALTLKAKRTGIDDIEGSNSQSSRKRQRLDENIELKITLAKDFTNYNISSFDALEARATPILKSDIIDNIAENVEIESSQFNINTPKVKLEFPVETSTTFDSSYSSDVQSEIESVKQWLKQENDIDIQINEEDIAACCVVESESMDNFFDDILSSDDDDSVSSSDSENKTLKIVSSPDAKTPDVGRKRKIVIKEEPHNSEEVPHTSDCSDSQYLPMSSTEEKRLLAQLQDMLPAVQKNVKARNLYRKLVVRQIKREKNLPVFDLDSSVRRTYGLDPFSGQSRIGPEHLGRQEILDRYQIAQSTIKGVTCHRGSFFSRLMGLNDEEQVSVISPYTTRILKPFIYRDYETEPPRLKLLREIISRSHYNDPSWTPPPVTYPIDYCYVRAQHIPAVNALCHEFFWPGIDLSECLQYPDFSCVALYRKVIIGFAFMVPDVNINEAYITYIFSHPDWRRAGIATFMLYHLVQTCMGKDITLHVSANSPAVFLYQKFGFKVEEFILDFYDKYLPPNSKECRHALFLRLSR